MSEDKRARKLGHIDMELFDEIDGWRGFIARIPGRVFNGVDLESFDGTIRVSAAYGVTSDGKDNKRYTADMRTEVEAIVAAQSSKVTSIAG